LTGSRPQWLFSEVDELVRSTYESATLETLVRHATAAGKPRAIVPVRRSVPSSRV
jgi:hypothetical protein